MKIKTTGPLAPKVLPKFLQAPKVQDAFSFYKAKSKDGARFVNVLQQSPSPAIFDFLVKVEQTGSGRPEFKDVLKEAVSLSPQIVESLFEGIGSFQANIITQDKFQRVLFYVLENSEAAIIALCDLVLKDLPHLYKPNIVFYLGKHMEANKARWQDALTGRNNLLAQGTREKIKAALFEGVKTFEDNLHIASCLSCLSLGGVDIVAEIIDLLSEAGIANEGKRAYLISVLNHNLKNAKETGRVLKFLRQCLKQEEGKALAAAAAGLLECGEEKDKKEAEAALLKLLNNPDKSLYGIAHTAANHLMELKQYPAALPVIMEVLNLNRGSKIESNSFHIYSMEAEDVFGKACCPYYLEMLIKDVEEAEKRGKVECLTGYARHFIRFMMKMDYKSPKLIELLKKLSETLQDYGFNDNYKSFVLEALTTLDKRSYEEVVALYRTNGIDVLNYTRMLAQTADPRGLNDIMGFVNKYLPEALAELRRTESGYSYQYPTANDLMDIFRLLPDFAGKLGAINEKRLIKWLTQLEKRTKQSLDIPLGGSTHDIKISQLGYSGTFLSAISSAIRQLEEAK